MAQTATARQPFDPVSLAARPFSPAGVRWRACPGLAGGPVLQRPCCDRERSRHRQRPFPESRWF